MNRLTEWCFILGAILFSIATFPVLLIAQRPLTESEIAMALSGLAIFISLGSILNQYEKPKAQEVKEK